MNPFRAPVKRTRHGFVVRLGGTESEVVLRLLGELRELLTAGDPTGGDPAGGDPAVAALTNRLFPVANPDDPEMEAEYQRLMRDELVQSRMSSIGIVEEILRSDEPIDEPKLTAFMQSINAVRLVLGTMLDVSDDPEADEVRAGLDDSPEHHLYAYLSWLLEHTVHALSSG
ncbi:hypothetical protein BH23ACT3_BH23ACT3_21660 [soil metagenome]